MASHAAGTIAFLAGAVQQTPVAQCTPTSSESWLKWLLPTVVQTVVSLASIAAGVLIAVGSFRANKRSEHEQWLRDQKKAEWRELLGGLNSVYFPMALAKEMKRPLAAEDSQKLLELSQCFQDRIFIDPSILGEFHEAVKKSALEYLGNSEVEQNVEIEHRKDAKEKVLRDLASLTAKVRDAAKADLRVER